MKIRNLGAALGLALTGSGVAWAGVELDMHGALAQGYVLSDGNDILGDSTSGSRDLYEVVLNGRTIVHPRLLVSGQLMARRAGNYDDGKIRVDFAQLDYQVVSGMKSDFGLRLGKLKNPYGFYNDSRDVVFARPGVTMPTSVYFEGQGLRDLFFSAEGGQLYGHYVGGLAVSEFTFGLARDFDATEAFERSLSQGGLEGDVEISNFMLGQWLMEWQEGRLRTGLSYLGAELDFVPSDPAAAAAAISLDADIWVLSAQYQGGRSIITGEYRYTDTRNRTVQGRSRSKSDGLYLQYRFLQSQQLEWYLRYDLSFSDRNDRDGSDFAGATGQPRHSRFSRDITAGLTWHLDSSWGLFAEHHYVDGSGTVDRVDNPGTIERYWQVSYLMLAYRF